MGDAPNRIYEVEIDLVRICNLRCRMCNFWTNTPNPNRTTTQELKSAIKNLHEWFNREFKIAFAGGEPFMRRDFLEIVKYASSLGIITTAITNGTLLTSEVIEGIFDSGLIGLTISIDSLNPEKHDYIRGVKGTFKKAIGAFLRIHKKRAKDKPPYLSIASIVSSFNHLDVVEILKWLHRTQSGFLVIQSLSYNFFPHTKEWFDEKLWPQSEKDKLAICESLRRLIKLKKRGYPLINEPSQIQGMIDYFINLDWKRLIQNES